MLNKLLVTGAAGGLGTLMRERLGAVGRSLRLSDITHMEPGGPEAEFVRCDLADPDAVKALVEGCDGILHLGGVSVEKSFETILPANIVGVYNLMGGVNFVSDMITGVSDNPTVIILLMMLILFVLGAFLDWVGIALLTMPIFVPIVRDLGMDPVWFGVLFCMNMQISFLSPPFGPAAFYLKSVTPPDISLGDIFKSLLPFICLQILAVGLLVAFPWITGR